MDKEGAFCYLRAADSVQSLQSFERAILTLKSIQGFSALVPLYENQRSVEALNDLGLSGSRPVRGGHVSGALLREGVRASKIPKLELQSLVCINLNMSYQVNRKFLEESTLKRTFLRTAWPQSQCN